MPNYCQNVARFYGNLEQIKVAVQSNKLFESFVPSDNTTESHIRSWGTKWEAEILSMTEHENHVTIVFDTAWEPPIKFYQKLPADIFVEAEYFEPGMRFCGYFHKERGDSRMDLILDPSWIQENVNQEIIDSFDMVNVAIEFQSK
jgi:hypothetical protein